MDLVIVQGETGVLPGLPLSPPTGGRSSCGASSTVSVIVTVIRLSPLQVTEKVQLSPTDRLEGMLKAAVLLELIVRLLAKVPGFHVQEVSGFPTAVTAGVNSTVSPG